MVDAWLRKFPELTLSVEYEKMVVAPKTVLGRIGEFCDGRMKAGIASDLGDDRDCSRHYREFMDTALRQDARERV